MFMGVDFVELGLCDVESVLVMFVFFLWFGLLGIDSFLFFIVRECFLFFNLLEWFEDVDNLLCVRFIFGFFGVVEVCEGFVDWVLWCLCGDRFVFFFGDVFMGLFEVEDFGLGVLFFIFFCEILVKFEVVIFFWVLFFIVGEEVFFVFNGDGFFCDCFVCFLGGEGEECIVLFFFFFDGEFIFEVDFFVFVFIGEGFFFNCFECFFGELGLGFKVLFLVFLVGGFGELDFFGVVLVGEMGFFGDFVFFDLSVL